MLECECKLPIVKCDHQGCRCTICGGYPTRNWQATMMAADSTTPMPKTYQDGINEGLEQAARYHDERAAAHDEAMLKDTNMVYFNMRATMHRNYAAAIRALKEKQDVGN